MSEIYPLCLVMPQIAELNARIARLKVYEVLQQFLKDKDTIIVRRASSDRKAEKSEDLVFVTTTGSPGDSFVVDVFSTNRAGTVAYTEVTYSGSINVFSNGRANQFPAKIEKQRNKNQTTADEDKDALMGQGYGNVMMERIIDYARGEGIKELYGTMMHPEDEEHASRMNKFYTKFNFTIRPNRAINLTLDS